MISFWIYEAVLIGPLHRAAIDALISLVVDALLHDAPVQDLAVYPFIAFRLFGRLLFVIDAFFFFADDLLALASVPRSQDQVGWNIYCVVVVRFDEGDEIRVLDRVIHD